MGKEVLNQSIKGGDLPEIDGDDLTMDCAAKTKQFRTQKAQEFVLCPGLEGEATEGRSIGQGLFFQETAQAILDCVFILQGIEPQESQLQPGRLEEVRRCWWRRIDMW